jgi:pimeloyl-ACP methyl ester carboxylesterase
MKVCAWLAIPPFVTMTLLVVTGAPTTTALLYLLGMALMIAYGAFRPKVPRAAGRAGGALVVAVILFRCCTAGEGGAISMNPSARLVDRVIDERDIALSGTRTLVGIGMFHDDRADVVKAMTDSYAEMSAHNGTVPSPVVATYLGLQGPDHYDLLVIEPHAQDPPKRAVIFLHGYGGNFTLPCWQVAEAVKSWNAVVTCPSTRYIGDWSSKNGEATVRDTVAKLNARGIKNIVLAGLSNGGYGGSILAARMRGSFTGLILISGATPEAGQAGVPTLLIHGNKDSMAGYEESVDYQANHVNSKLVTLDAGHFAMLVRKEKTNAAIDAFVSTIWNSARPSP